jgi:hypothetical protein
VGLARLLRGNQGAAIENIALWHERDISHSSVERVIFPDSFLALDHMLRRFTRIVADMVVYPDRMLRNLELSRGVVFSGTVLLALASRGVSRELAYEWVQRNAMRSFDEGVDFKALLLADADMRELAKEELALLRPRLDPAEALLKLLLIPRDPNDDKDVIVEVRAGAGGDEAGLFAAEVLRLYIRYAERRGWRVELMDTSAGSLGGIHLDPFTYHTSLDGLEMDATFRVGGIARPRARSIRGAGFPGVSRLAQGGGGERRDGRHTRRQQGAWRAPLLHPHRAALAARGLSAISSELGRMVG